MYVQRFLPHGLAQARGPLAFLSAGYNHNDRSHRTRRMMIPGYHVLSSLSLDEAELHRLAKLGTCQMPMHYAARD